MTLFKYGPNCLQQKGESRLELTSQMDDEKESVSVEGRCAPHVSRLRLEPPDTPGNCSTPAKYV